MKSLYDQDFYTWTQTQAEAIRSLRPPASNSLDTERLAEEVADLGKSELSKVYSLLAQAVAHLIKAAVAEDAMAQKHWQGEVVAFLDTAQKSYSPGMRQHLSMGEVWKGAIRRAKPDLKSYGLGHLPLPNKPDLDIEELLDPDFDYEAAVLKLRT